MSKVKRQKVKQESVVSPHSQDEIRSQLQIWAHEGSAESIKKLEEFIYKEEGDWELQSYAMLAKDEARYFYYLPKNQTEEKDLILVKMIRGQEDSLLDLESEASSLKYELQKKSLDKAVHAQIIKGVNKKLQEEWKYNYLEDMAVMDRNRLIEIKNQIAYATAWVETAKKMVKTKRYIDAPLGVLDGIKLDGENFRHREFDSCDAGDCSTCGDVMNEINTDGIPF